ncbi:MAG: hypothetical protein ACYS8W_06925 [Planctomycetota bacterium]|jgi:hypothetical protein
MEFKPYDFSDENENKSQNHLPVPPPKPGQDPIPFLFWNMLTMAKKFNDLKKNLAEFKQKNEEETGIPICPKVIRQALGRRCSEMTPIREDEAAGVPWDEFYIWLGNSENEM